MRRPFSFVFVAAVALAGAPVAWAQPDFSGTWVVTAEAPPAPLTAAPTGILGERFGLRMSGNELTFLRPIRDEVVPAKFVVDGRETRTRTPGNVCQADSESIWTAKREGDALMISTVGVIPPGGGAVAKREIVRTLRLVAPDRLTVEATATMQGERRQVATVYRKSTDVIAEPPAGPAKAAATIAKVAWIGGTWIGGTAPTTVEERWTPTSGGAMLAVARTMRDGVMSSFEFLCIAERDGGLVYFAMPNGRSPATPFTLTSVTEDVATFENPAHDYPKVIRYSRRPDGSLETFISGAGGQRPFTIVLKKQ